MKISFDIDCTPEEARRLFGLPDLTAVNELIASELERRTEENLDTLADPKAFWDRAISSGFGGMDALAEAFRRAGEKR